MESALLSGGGGGGGSYDPLSAIADLRDAKKAIKKQKREERKAFRKQKKELFKTYSPEKQEYLKKKFQIKTDNLKKEKEKRRDNHQFLVETKNKQRVSFDGLNGSYTPYTNVRLLLEIFVRKLVVYSPIEGGINKIQISPKWIEFLKLAKVIEKKPVIGVVFRYQYRWRRKYHSDDSPIARVSIPLFFSLDKLYKDFALKRSLKKEHLDKSLSCINLITKLIKKYKRFSPRLQKFLDLLEIKPSFNIEHVNVLPENIVSLFPEEAPFDGKLVEECPICYIKDLEPAIRLPCKHIVHTECIKLWFKKERSCASCRAKC